MSKSQFFQDLTVLHTISKQNYIINLVKKEIIIRQGINKLQLDKKLLTT